MESTLKVAIVTGAGSGIGRVTAEALWRGGYAVVLAGRRREALESVVREAGVEAGRTLVVPTDVTQVESVRGLFDQTKARFGRLDVLFNNAGVSAPNVCLDEVPFERWQEVIATNLTGAFLCTQEAFRMMKEQRPAGGRIINNGSISAQVPRLYSAPYAIAKHGITGLTKTTALDGRRHGIACGQIDIGNADTSMGSQSARGTLQADGTIAVEPIFDAKHVADAVVYMAGLPLHANVPFLTLIATAMPYGGRG